MNKVTDQRFCFWKCPFSGWSKVLLIAKMELSMKQTALMTSFFGICSFLCGVVAENKKVYLFYSTSLLIVVWLWYVSDHMLCSLNCTCLNFKLRAFYFCTESLSFMKPAAGTPIPGKGMVICKYPSDPTVILGYISFAALIITTVVGYMSVFYPYNKRSIPSGALFRSKTMLVFFNIAW